MSVEPIESGDVTVSLEGRVMVMTMARPAKRNALTGSMYRTMADTLGLADSDPEVAAVVITGTGVAFTAGNDLGEFAAGGSLDEVAGFLRTISSVQVPVIAAVNGMAVGIGLTMLLHCDLVYVEPSAILSAPFVGLGLVPEAASSLLLPRVIGERRASELLLTGRLIDGTEATAWGLANAAVSPVLDHALNVAAHLAAQPPQALRATKGLLRSADRTVPGRMDEELERFEQALRGPEFAKVVAARQAKLPK